MTTSESIQPIGTGAVPSRRKSMMPRLALPRRLASDKYHDLRTSSALRFAQYICPSVVRFGRSADHAREICREDTSQPMPLSGAPRTLCDACGLPRSAGQLPHTAGPASSSVMGYWNHWARATGTTGQEQLQPNVKAVGGSAHAPLMESQRPLHKEVE